MFMIIILLVSLLIMGANAWMESSYHTGKVDTINHEISSIKESLEDLSENNGNPEQNKVIKNLHEQEDLLKKQLIALDTEDWRTYLEAQIEIDKRTIKGLDSGSLFGGEPLGMIENRLFLNQELLERNIPPSAPDYATNGFHSLKNVLKVFMSFMGILIFLIILGDLFSNEYEMGTSKFLFAHPIKKSKVLTAKFLVSLMAIGVILLTVSLLSFVLASIFKGIGNYNFPMIIQKNNEQAFMDLWLFLIKSSLLFIFVIAFVILFQFLFSIITRSNLLSIGITIILSAIFYMSIVQYNLFKSIAHIVPFTYLDPFSIVNGNLSKELSNSQVSTLAGVLCLIGFGIILYITSIMILRKQEA